jgi:hypothetical protein
MESEKLICGDCKGITTFRKGKRGSAFLEKILWWTLFFPGFFYSIWRSNIPKKICSYCGSEFLLPADSPYSHDLLKPIIKNK